MVPRCFLRVPPLGVQERRWPCRPLVDSFALPSLPTCRDCLAPPPVARRAPPARLVGQYGQLAAVADHKAPRGVIGHPPSGADEATLYLSLIRRCLPFP